MDLNVFCNYTSVGCYNTSGKQPKGERNDMGFHLTHRLLDTYAPNATIPFVGVTLRTRYDDLFVGKSFRIEADDRPTPFHQGKDPVKRIEIECFWLVKARLIWDFNYEDPIIYPSSKFRPAWLSYSTNEANVTRGGLIVHTGVEEVTILPRTQIVLDELIRIEKWATENHLR